ncbi:MULTISPECIES: hypothetical protein [Vibrio]|uniref:hypothetical protein n=1 Tax=Vibrio TaxID=662 RepID=UPI001BD3445D|nr:MULTISPECIES: hypothetical protein [Vibrio]MBT0068356.1 hypothetical protein [Vibrio alginolyticus]MDW1943818.1 hypothetical protein [Vibrio sp. Vb0599]MDW3053274.1 hypothetical protein [Vibrio sp. 1408]
MRGRQATIVICDDYDSELAIQRKSFLAVGVASTLNQKAAFAGGLSDGRSGKMYSRQVMREYTSFKRQISSLTAFVKACGHFELKPYQKDFIERFEANRNVRGGIDMSWSSKLSGKLRFSNLAASISSN